ncbi:MAG TPA: erythromycin esterase family protein [Thermoanaerobaculia bacterium]|nr:erythromycin esterase family protein [Thermoanaerobaculia bacterium]
MLVLACLALDASAKRRAVHTPDVFPLHSVELTSDTRDLAPLQEIVGDATIVGLGDATHGTHEFFAVKLRLIDYLVREMQFDVLSIEGPFPIFERVNRYVQTGEGDPRALLREARTRLLYLFWDVEEMLAVIEWVRAYNLTHERRISIAGADIYDYEGAVAGVMAHMPEAELSCVLRGENTSECLTSARQVRETLVARGAHPDAIHYADIVLQSFDGQLYEPREEAMAANLLWIREHRGTKVIHWGHQEHVGKLSSRYTRGRTMGTILAGEDYVAIGTLTGSGSFLQWERSGSIWTEVVRTFPDPAPGSYEARYRARGFAAMLVPLRGRSGEASFRTAGTTSGWTTMAQSLPQKLDAVIYVDVTTPTRPLGTPVSSTGRQAEPPSAR